MDSQIKEWRVKHFLLLMNEAGISNRRLFNLVKRLKEVYDSIQERTDNRDLPIRLSIQNENNEIMSFRGRGDYGECIICGARVNNSMLCVHLRRHHNVSASHISMLSPFC